MFHEQNSLMFRTLEKVSFNSNPKEQQCQKIFKLPGNCSYFTCQQINAQNFSKQASTLCELVCEEGGLVGDRVGDGQIPLPLNGHEFEQTLGESEGQNWI